MHRHRLPVLLVGILLADAGLGLRAQTPTRPTPMERLGEHVAELQNAVAERDRPAIHRAAEAIAAQTSTIDLAQPWPMPAVAQAAVREIVAAALAIRTPAGDGKGSDAHDLHRLRTACTTCHAHNRPAPVESNWFPNRGNLVFGTVRVADREGTPHADHDGVVIFLEGSHPPPRPLGRPPAIVQRGRRFEPKVLAITVGTEVDFPNDDVVFHNVFSLSKGNAFDLGTYQNGQSKTRRFDVAGLARVHCNIHPEMTAHVLVLNTPLHAVSTRDGSFCIPDVPDGTYTLRVWQALSDEQRQTIEVGSAHPAAIDLAVRESKPRARHTDKNGRPYRDKY
jgi:hypothetical protein